MKSAKLFGRLLLVLHATWVLGACADVAPHAPDYEMRAVAQGFRADNPGHALSVSLTNGSASVITTSQQVAVRARLELTAFGRGEGLEPVPLRSVAKRGQRVEHDRGTLREWFVNGPRGLQQGFDIATRPDGEGPLALEIAFEGLTPVLRGDSRVALLDRGRERLSYDTLRAWDATGAELPARMQVREGRVRLVVDDAGAVYPLVVDPYLQQVKLTGAPPHRNMDFGAALAGEGQTLVVTAKGDNEHGSGSGAVHVFDWNGDEWVRTAKLHSSQPQARERFGNSVALSGDTLIVGADLSAGVGAAYVFVREEGVWRHQARLVAGDAQTDQFGFAVAVSGNLVAVSAAQTPRGPLDSVYLFARDGETWRRTAVLPKPSESDPSSFGWSLAMAGDRLLVGAPSAYGGSVGPEAAYVYTRTGEDWSLHTKLQPTRPQLYPSFGNSVSIDADTIVVGADWDGEGDLGPGAAYVYRLQNGIWRQEARLVASDPSEHMRFGSSVDVQGNRVAVGAHMLTAEGKAGAAYGFVRTGNVWFEQTKLTASDGREKDAFGAGVVQVDGQIAVGAPRREEVGTRSGAVYVFEDRALTLGDPCRSGNECPSGFCVDGVCCDQSCTGGTLDCRACRGALTGQPDGTCALLAEGAACGDSTDNQCDAPDQCSAAGVCLNNRAAEGAPCEAGAYCTSGDACQTGVCIEGLAATCRAAEKCNEEQDLCFPRCGDGTLDSGEQCDDGDLNSDALPGACRTHCVPAYCGDGVVDAAEQCDRAALNSDSTPNACRTTCRTAFCGDATLDSGEGCDLGTRNGSGRDAQCRTDCSAASCGDGVRDSGEACDDGPLNSRTKPDACRPTCVLAYCGDGVLDQDEQCEPALHGARCDATCIWAPEPEVDAALPAQEDAGMPAPPPDAGMPAPALDDAGTAATNDSPAGCTLRPGARSPWVALLPLFALLGTRLRSARRARRASPPARS